MSLAPPDDGDPWRETRVVGTRRARVDAYERVSGSAIFPSDIVVPGMLYAAILRCPHPHARVRGGMLRPPRPGTPSWPSRWTTRRYRSSRTSGAPWSGS
jgi:hypothetical protein